MLLDLHSGLRYLVLLAGIAALVGFAVQLAKKAPWNKTSRILNSSFTGFLDLQALIGLVLFFSGNWAAQTAGHLALMILAVVNIHAFSVANKKRNDGPSPLLGLIGVSLTLLLIFAGILAIGRPIF